MRTPSPGVLRRISAVFAALSILTAVGLPSAASAHSGHDHASAGKVENATSVPRFTVQSENYELVGVVQSGRLRIFLDRFATNEAVTDAKISVTLGSDGETIARNEADGTYTVISDTLAGQGAIDLIVTVTAPSGDDLLIGSLQLPSHVMAPTRPELSFRDRLLQKLGAISTGSLPLGASGTGGLALAFGVLVGVAARRKSRLVAVIGLGLAAFALSTASGFSHEGESHGSEAVKSMVSVGDAPQRLPGGTVFLPKTSQRILEVRTAIAKSTDAQKAIHLVGRVISDPNRGGLVQSIGGGRVVAPERGLPRVGQAVKKGEILASIERPLPPEERINLSEKTGELDQLIASAETKLNRVRQLVERKVAPPSQVSDAEVELDGLRRRREIIRSTRAELEELRASADGVIASAKVAAGQVVQAQDVLFQIVDPDGFLIEALAYNAVDPMTIATATAVGADGRTMNLRFQGFSRALQQQAIVIQFTIEGRGAGLNVGQPVAVYAKSGAPVNGIILPRDAVVRGNSGEPLVWRHTAPEQFEARPVRTESFDATKVIVRAGIAENDRIVTRGAELINQIR
jgi:cobalt-zinc-cadmium efflux system membrane fusion protein